MLFEVFLCWRGHKWEPVYPSLATPNSWGRKCKRCGRYEKTSWRSFA